MSAKATDWVWKTDVPYPERLVLLNLAFQADDDGRVHPDPETTARATGLPAAKVMQCVAILLMGGFLRLAGNGYTLAIDAEPAQ